MRWALLWMLLITLVLIPFFLFEEQFTAFAAEMTRAGGPRSTAGFAIALLLALDVFLPVPSSIVSTAAGVLFGFWRGAAMIWTGMTAGCLLGYVVGVRASGIARRIVGAESLERATRLSGRYGDWTIVLCRPVPVLAEASVLFAGIIRAPFARVMRLTALANLGIALGYAAFGAFSMRVDSFLLAFVGALVIPGALMALSKLTFSKAERQL
jgi:uncharacterized membrane protein YdjX (TVP38/TMEM64 family)